MPRSSRVVRVGEAGVLCVDCMVPVWRPANFQNPPFPLKPTAFVPIVGFRKLDFPRAVTLNQPANAPLNRPPRVLVVEDDLTSREHLRLVLERKGCVITTADSVDAAQRAFAEKGDRYFDTIVTDYRMPGRTGLDLLEWLKQKDSCLATIILTGEGEKEIVAESLRAGASDFLEKPVDLQKLLPALAKAVGVTRRLRHLAETESAVQSLGQTQKGLINFEPVAVPGGGTVQVEVCFHPKLEAGGDFFSHFQPAPEKMFCLLTDVSGHDLQAAYISAYFQGLVRGMLQRAAPVPEIFDCFNRFLLEEWNAAGQFRLSQNNFSTSVAAASVLLNFKHKTAGVLTCGAPAPVLITADGRAQLLGDGGGPPLGWFPEHTARGSIHPLADGGKICLWTDGLDDLAETFGVHPLCLAFVLEQAAGKKLPLLAEAQDDILFARIILPATETVSSPLKTLLLAEYHGGQAAEIDRLAAGWRRNLEFALAGIEDSALHDILLAAREAVLNAMQHGCTGRAGRRLRFQISFDPETAGVKIWVEDPGPGHQFDVAAHAPPAAGEIADAHRGLVFMQHLAHAVTFERNGASVMMDFQLAKK